jgi:pyruvate dehydrogenase E2 component (dihydrolipoamide acetyltransferase)
LELKLPQFGNVGGWSGKAPPEGEIVRWLVGDGVQVEAGQEVVEVAIDKVNVNVAAPLAGRLRHRVREGDVVMPGELIAEIVAD